MSVHLYLSVSPHERPRLLMEVFYSYVYWTVHHLNS